MRRRGRSASSISTIEILGAVVFLFIVVIVAAFIFAPDKPTAPPVSVVTYEEPPEPEARPSYRPEFDFPEQPTPQPAAVSTSVRDTFEITGEEAPNYVLTGQVTEARTGEPVQNAVILVRRIITDAETQVLNEMLAASNPPILLEGEEGPEVEEARAAAEEASEAYRKEQRRLEASRRVRSNEDGEYKLSMELEGEYVLSIRDQRYINHPQQDFVVYEEKKEYQIDVSLSLGAIVTGRVLEASTHKPASGITVVLGRPRNRVNVEQFFFRGGINDRRDRDVETNLEGEYTLSGLEPGEYSVFLQLRNTPYRSEKVLPYRTISVNNPDQEIRNIDFTVDVAGIVWGYVKNQDEEPIRADVVLCTDDSVISQVLDAALNQAPPITDNSNRETGYYELKGIPLNEEWRLYAASDNLSAQMTDPFILTSSRRSARVDITLFGGTDISGRVIDTSGTPVPHADVVCFSGISTLFRRMQSPPAFRDAKSDGEGYFHIEQLPPGQFQIHATKDGYKFSARGEPVYVDGFSDIRNFDIVLHPIDEGSETVYGKVVDTTGRAVSGARVGLSGLGVASLSGIDRSMETGADGVFVFESVEVGSYVLNVSANGYSSKMVHKVLFNKEMLVELEAGAILAGKVYVRETGQILPGGRVSAIPINETGETAFGAMLTNGPQSSSSSVNQDGEFQISVRAGRYRVEARQNGFAPGRIEVEVGAGERLDGLRLQVSQSGGSISGRVVSDSGDSVRGTTLILVEGQSMAETAMLLAGSMDASSGRLARAGEDGVFRFEILGPGFYNVIAQHPSYPQAESGMVELGDGENISGVEVRLGAGGGVEGYVYRNQRPVHGASVMAMANGIPNMTTADDNGFYYFDSLSPGMYQLMIVPEGIEDLTNLANLQSVTVEVFDNRITQQDLGDSLGGARILGVCDPKPDSPGFTLVYGFVQVRSQSTPPMLPLGESADFTAFLQQTLGSRGAMINADGTFEVNNIAPGSYALDAYYPEGLSLRFVSTQPLEVPEDAEDIPVTIEFNLE